MGNIPWFCALAIVAVTIFVVGVLPLVYIVVLSDREAPARRVMGMLRALAVPLRAWRRK